MKITEENAEFQYRNARTLVLAMNAIITSMFTYISWQTILLAEFSKNTGAGIAFVFMILLFVIIIVYIKKSMKE